MKLYTFLVAATMNLDTLYLRETVCGDLFIREVNHYDFVSD